MNNNIPQGYKESPLGVIPQDWEVRRLGEVCTHFKSGLGITANKITAIGEYPVYGGNGLRGYCDNYTHDGDYVLIGRQGALCGNINFVSGKSYISEHAIAVQVEGNIHWLKYKLDYWNLNRFSESSAQPGLSVEKLVRYKLTIPPLAEQERIAEVLGTWDVAIEKQGALVDALTRRKRALMQQLLTARKRLPSFSVPWQVYKLNNVYSSIPTFSFARDKMTIAPQNLMYIHYGDIHLNTNKDTIDLKCDILPYIEDGHVSLDKLNSDNFPYLKNGDILLADASEDKEGVGSPLEIIDTANSRVIGGLHTIALRPNKSHIAVGYGRYLFKNNDVMSMFRRISQGTKVYAISYNLIKDITITLPPLEEQKAISQILTTADREIELATTKLNSLRTQKRALMQQLLTGKKRLKI